MKKLIIIFLVIFAISLCADELEWGTSRHVVCAFIGDGIIQIACNNITFTQNHVSEATFFVSFTGLTVYELWSNKWQGFKFWDYTGSIFGMVLSRELWKDRKPIIYPMINSKNIGVKFSIDIS